MAAITPMDIHVRLYFRDPETGRQHDAVYRHLTLEDAVTLVKAHSRNGGHTWDMFTGGGIKGRVAPPRIASEEFKLRKVEWSVAA